MFFTDILNCFDGKPDFSFERFQDELIHQMQEPLGKDYNWLKLDMLNALLDSASNSLNEKRRDAARQANSPARGIKPLTPILDTENTGILFTGNPHEAVPRRLLLDNRLTPLERNAWQVSGFCSIAMA